MAKIEFNEENVRREMADELGVDPADLVVDESPLASFGEEALQVRLGQKEYTVVEDEETAERLALAVVTQDLEQEPELFNPDFLARHIDMKKLEEWVYEAAMEDDYAYDLARRNPEFFWEIAEQWDVEDLPEPDEYGNRPDHVDQRYIDALQEAIARNKAKDPMGFFEDIYGRRDAIKYAIEAAGIDIEAAAEEAVSVDGWQHFLARYDGKSHETKSGFVYWREN